MLSGLSIWSNSGSSILIPLGSEYGTAFKSDRTGRLQLQPDLSGLGSLCFLLSPDATGPVVIYGSVALSLRYQFSAVVEITTFRVLHTFVSSVLEE